MTEHGVKDSRHHRHQAIDDSHKLPPGYKTVPDPRRNKNQTRGRSHEPLIVPVQAAPATVAPVAKETKPKSSKPAAG